MERIVSGSGLEWTIVRLNRLTNNPTRASVRLSTEPFDKTSPVSRANAATALLNLVEAGTTAKTAIML
jgi:NAD(P)H-binding